MLLMFLKSEMMLIHYLIDPELLNCWSSQYSGHSIKIFEFVAMMLANWDCLLSWICTNYFRPANRYSLPLSVCTTKRTMCQSMRLRTSKYCLCFRIWLRLLLLEGDLWGKPVFFCWQINLDKRSKSRSTMAELLFVSSWSKINMRGRLNRVILSDNRSPQWSKSLKKTISQV